MLHNFDSVAVGKERAKLHCVDCKRLTIHNLEARCVGSWIDDGSPVQGGSQYSIFRCGACDAVCYETSYWNTEEYWNDAQGNIHYLDNKIQYPAPVSLHFNFNTEYVPDKLGIILDEMLYSLAGSKTILSTIGLRLAVEFIVNDKNCSGRDLKNKIDDLHRQSLIDEDQKELLHRIRLRGNAGAHSAIAMQPAEIVAGMGIIEGLLEKLYNGPARHSETVTRARLLIAGSGSSA